MSTKVKVLLIGGHGKVSLKLTPLLLSRSHQVTSLIRDPAQKAEIIGLGDGKGSASKIDVIVESLEDVKTETDARRILEEVKPQWVVWSAGAGGKGSPERTKAIDQVACIAFIKASISTPSITKFLLVSTLLTRRNKAKWWEDAEWTHVQKYWSDIMPGYLKAKLAADEALSVLGSERRNNDKDFKYICLRPGTLTDDAGSAKVQLGETRAKGSISREDVADIGLRLLESGANGWFDLIEGEEGSEQAVKRVVDGGINAMQGEDVKVMKENM